MRRNLKRDVCRVRCAICCQEPQRCIQKMKKKSYSSLSDSDGLHVSCWVNGPATARPRSQLTGTALPSAGGVGRTPVYLRPLTAPHATRIPNCHVPFDRLLMGLGVLQFSAQPLAPSARGGHFLHQLVARRARCPER